MEERRIYFLKSIIRQGIALDAFVDSNPEMTSQYIPNVDGEVLTDHIQRFVRTALTGMKEGP